MELIAAGKTIGAINAIGFAVTAATRTHKVTDLCGTAAFAATAIQLLQKAKDPRAKFLNIAVIVYGVRLGTYLFSRVLKIGHDSRLNFLFPKPGETWADPNGAMFPFQLGGFWFLQVRSSMFSLPGRRGSV